MILLKKSRLFVLVLFSFLPLLTGLFFIFSHSAYAGCSAVSCLEISCESNQVSVPVCKAEKCDPYGGARPFPCASTNEVEQCGLLTDIGSQCKNSAAECASGTSPDTTCAGKFCPSGKVFCKSTNNCPNLSDHCVASGICSSNANSDCASVCAAANPNKPVYCRSSTPLCPSGICVNDEGSCSNGVDDSGSCTGQVCCKASSNTSCSGKDSSGATQTGTCSTTSTCSSGTALTSATGCSSGKACCYSSSSGDKCEDTSGQKCSADCSEESGYESGGTGTCSDSAKSQCCKSKQVNSSVGGGLIPCGNSGSPCTLCHLFLLVKNLFDWIFRVMTYIAFAVLVAMGILYIVSAGNTQLINMAKKGIESSLIGFAIVLLGWVAINVVLMVLADGVLGSGTATFSIKTNGSWFDFNCSTTSKYTGTGGTEGTGGTGGTGDGNTGGGSLDCKTGKCATNTEIANAVKNNNSGTNPNAVMAIIDGGESCNKNKSPRGACGYSQMMPNMRTWCGITGDEATSCTTIQNNITVDINCGAKFISTNGGRSTSVCGYSGGVVDIRQIASCYNTGQPNKCASAENNYCGRVETYYNSCLGK